MDFLKPIADSSEVSGPQVKPKQPLRNQVWSPQPLNRSALCPIGLIFLHLQGLPKPPLWPSDKGRNSSLSTRTFLVIISHLSRDDSPQGQIHFCPVHLRMPRARHQVNDQLLFLKCSILASPAHTVCHGPVCWESPSVPDEVQKQQPCKTLATPLEKSFTMASWYLVSGIVTVSVVQSSASCVRKMHPVH